MRHRDVPETGCRGVLLFRIADDEQVRRQRHHLPCEEERRRVVGARHEAHARDEDTQQRVGRAAAQPSVKMTEISDAVDRSGHACETDDGEEEGGERIDAKGDAAERLQQIVPAARPRGPFAQHGHAEGERGRRSDSRRDQRHTAQQAAERKKDRRGCANRERPDHQIEQQRKIHGRRAPFRSRRPIAMRMPCRICVGSGGHPATYASTGMIESTGPATA